MTGNLQLPAANCPVANSRRVATSWMMFRMCVATLVLVLGLTTLPAGAADGDVSEGLRRCTAISADADRLACFDALARGQSGNAQAGGQGPAAVGRWQIEAGPGGSLKATQRPVEPWDDEQSLILQVTCDDDRAGLSVTREIPIANSFTSFVTVRVGNRLVPGDLWTVSRDYRTANFSGDVQDFLRALPATGQIAIRMEGSRRWRFEGTFELEGIADIRSRVAASCRR
ncbi:hypothetical protein [Phreatobacter sp.]|uniref:hypothetical protein n=1 Tax=Phreatobacter sp. TaxID=1966341 RepID=UPI003F718589